jgi:hypothetical protein
MKSRRDAAAPRDQLLLLLTLFDIFEVCSRANVAKAVTSVCKAAVNNIPCKKHKNSASVMKTRAAG